MDDLVRALGADSGISKSEVSRICADLDGEVGAFWTQFLRSLKARGLAGVQLVIATPTSGSAKPSAR